MASHNGVATWCESALFLILSYTEVMCRGAGSIFERACGASIMALSAGDNFDMMLWRTISISGCGSDLLLDCYDDAELHYNMLDDCRRD